MRPNTERPITVEIGSNTLLDFDVDLITSHVGAVLRGDYKKGRIPELWDGQATGKILGRLKNET